MRCHQAFKRKSLGLQWFHVFRERTPLAELKILNPDKPNAVGPDDALVPVKAVV